MPLKREIKSRGLRYLGFTNFDAADAAALKRRFHFHDLDLEDCQSEQERPKIDEYEKYLFLVFQIPVYDNHSQLVETAEVNIFIGTNYLVVNHDNDIPWFKQMAKSLETPRGRKEYMSHGAGYFLYRIVEGLFESNFKVLDRLQRELRHLEREIFTNQEMRDRLEDIMRLKKSIITFRRTIAPQRSVVSQLEHKNKKFLQEDLEVYFDDVVDVIEKVWQSLEILKETAETLESTNENLISHYTNNTMKILTIMSVVMLPLTFITSLYGMNIGLPYENNPQAFSYVIGGMSGLLIFMLGLFYYKRWL